MSENEYHLESVNQRILDLILVQNYDRHNGFKYLTYYDRIQICQERSAMQSFKNYLFREIKHEAVNWFRVPEELEEKIKRIQLLIQQQNYELKTEIDNRPLKSNPKTTEGSP
jgi:DNA polymerase III epsilon subunit-like protein